MKIFEIAIYDQDRIVRASAVLCLHEMIKVNEFCSYIRESYDIYVSK